jgi:hypothetical protein
LRPLIHLDYIIIEVIRSPGKPGARGLVRDDVDGASMTRRRMIGSLLGPLLIVAAVFGKHAPAPPPPPPDTKLLYSSISVVEALLVSIEVAASSFADDFTFSSTKNTSHVAHKETWLQSRWRDAGACIASDYRHTNATCSEERKKDASDPCAVQNPLDPALYHADYYDTVVPQGALYRTARVLDLAAPTLRVLLPRILGDHNKDDGIEDKDSSSSSSSDGFSKKRIGSEGMMRRGGGIPAVVHQTWKALDVGEEVDFKKQMDAWEDDDGQWLHLVWTDLDLNRLLKAAFPWLQPSMRRMKRPVDKIDVMRYVLLFSFGGVYMDADQVVVQVVVGGNLMAIRW